MIRLIDVSAYQPKPRWQEVRAAGAVGCIIKLTDGNHYVNPYALEQLTGAIAAGLFPMVYHFAQPNGPDWLADAVDEAIRLDTLVDELEQKHGRALFTWCDIERNMPLTPAEKPHWRDWLKEFSRASIEDGGRRTGDYSYKPFLEALELPEEYSQHLLWLARYPGTFQRDATAYGSISWPTAIRPWKRADLWQDGGDANGATWPGIDGKCDCSVFAGELQELIELTEVSA